MQNDKQLFTPRQPKTNETTPEQRKEYSSILQGKPTNTVTKTSKKSLALDPFTETGRANREGVQVFLKNYNALSLNVQTHKVLDALTIKLTNNFPFGETATAEQIAERRIVEITVDEYMQLCGLKDRKEARKQLKEAIQTLYNISLEWDEVSYIVPEGKKKRVKQSVHYNIRLTDAIIELEENPLKRGKVVFAFSFTLAQYLSKAYIMPYPNKLLALNAKYNPHSYYMGRKLAEHHNMNIGKENANRIAVSTLLKALPDMPTYAEVMQNMNGSLTQKIIQPFERDLIALVNNGILASWKYCNSKGEPLTEEQIDSYSYDVWEKWLIEFELADYPDQSERLEKIAERKKIATKKKAQNAKKKQDSEN